MATKMKVDLVEETRRIGPVLRRNAERSDRECKLPAESLDVMREAGLLRLYVPRSLGGLEVDPVTHTRIQEELSRHDSAAGWVLQVCSASDWWCSRLPTQAVEEIYADGPDHIITAAFSFPVEATAVDGGFRLSGQRPFASYVSSSTWIWVTALNMQDGEPESVEGNPVMRGCFFRTGEANIVPTWDTLGMRGTDSNDVDVEGVVVPETNTFRVGIDHTPGSLYDGPLYRTAVMGFVATILPAVALGVARSAIDELIAIAMQGKTPFSSGTTLRERPVVQGKVGRAEGALRSARTYLYDRIGDAWERAVAGGDYTLEEKTEVLLACTQAVDSSVAAVDLMYSASGTSGVYKRNRLEQLFRDAQVLRQHGFVAESRFETVGQVAFGLAPELGFVAL
jgi:alkylation response protein AidB-like acyl-CoA dehydrogenase